MPIITYFQSYDATAPCGWTYRSTSEKGLKYRIGLHQRNCKTCENLKLNWKGRFSVLCDPNLKEIAEKKLYKF